MTLMARRGRVVYEAGSQVKESELRVLGFEFLVAQMAILLDPMRPSLLSNKKLYASRRP
jgi:hypothetical protein